MNQRNSVRDSGSFSFEIIRHYGVLSNSSRGWSRELNFVKWNDREPKFDIRDWQPDHKKMSKGITLSEGEMAELINIIKSNSFDSDSNGPPAENDSSEMVSESVIHTDEGFCTQAVV